MVRKLCAISIGVCALTLGACTTSGNMERNAIIGTGLGAGVGAIIGNNTGSGDAGTGALIGGIVGGTGGAYSGYIQDQNTYNRNPYYNNRNPYTRGPQLHFDQRYRRYFYVNPQNGRTYWQNGEYRY